MKPGTQGVFFSICIPVYNVEQYLDECIQSVLKQSESDYEIILVNDGSKDASGKLCDLYATRYPEVIRVIHKQNEGLLLARYDAILNAKGKYLLFLDSDDYYTDSNVLENLKKGIEQYSADMVIFDWVRIFPDGSKMYDTCNFPNQHLFTGEGKKELYMEIVTGFQINSIAKKCVKKELFIVEPDYKRYKGLNQSEDKFLSLPCIDAAERIVYLKAPFYAYRTNYNSVTNNLSIQNYKDIQQVQLRTTYYREKWHLGNDAKNMQDSSRLRFGIDCISSVYQRLKNNNTTEEELKNIVDFIWKDEDYKAAYARGKEYLSLSYRVSCWLLIKNHKKFLLLWLTTWRTLARILNHNK